MIETRSVPFDREATHPDVAALAEQVRRGRFPSEADRGRAVRCLAEYAAALGASLAHASEGVVQPLGWPPHGAHEKPRHGCPPSLHTPGGFIPGFLKRGHTLSAAELGLSLPRQPMRHAIKHRETFDIIDVLDGEHDDGDPLMQMHAAWAKRYVPVGRRIDEQERRAKQSLNLPSSPKASPRKSYSTTMTTRKATYPTLKRAYSS